MIHRLKCLYVEKQVEWAKLPAFADGELKRYNINFSGKVQNVGFRLEVICLAKRLGLAGWVNNLPDGSVEGEFQGTQERIDFLVSFMSGLKRVRIDKLVKKELPVDPEAAEFISDFKS